MEPTSDRLRFRPINQFPRNEFRSRRFAVCFLKAGVHLLLSYEREGLQRTFNCRLRVTLQCLLISAHACLWSPIPAQLLFDFRRET